MAKKKKYTNRRSRTVLDGVQDDITGVTKAGIGIGVGSVVLGGLGTKAGRDVGAGALGSMAGMMGPMATVTMAGRTLQATRRLSPKKKKKTRKRRK